jgi:RNA polymerase sigma-70 factor (ECF subfamily)
MIGFFYFYIVLTLMAQSFLEDKELLVQFNDPATKERGFTAIIKKYQEKLYWHIRRMVVEHEDANDILQNMFIKVWKGLENFREDSQLYTWMYRIATNESLTFLQQQKKRKTLSISDDESGLSNQIKADKNFDINKNYINLIVRKTCTLKTREIQGKKFHN